MNRNELQAHIDQLAAEHNITIQQDFDLAGMMYVEEIPPRIKAPALIACPAAPTINLCYMVALHEIGHVVHGHTQGRPPFEDQRHYFDNGVLRSEAEAWEFAFTNKRVDLAEAECEHIAHNYIGSYINSARARSGKLTRLMNGDRYQWHNRARLLEAQQRHPVPTHSGKRELDIQSRPVSPPDVRC